MKNNTDILELDDAYVLNYHDKNSRYGEALSIDILDDPSNPESNENKIDTWLKQNGDERGTSSAKVLTDKYTDKDYIPFYFKITLQTKIVDLNGKKVSKDELVKGTNIGLVARAVPYEYEGRSGVMRLLETIVVYEPKYRTKTNLEHIKRMREERMNKNNALKSSKNDNIGEAEPIDNKEADEKSEAQTNATSDSMLSPDEIPF